MSTNFPNGVSSMGIPLVGGYAINPFGNVWFVDAKIGGDGNTGKRRDRAFLTMEEAFDHVGSGDTIIARGKIREQLSTPVGKFDVTIIGASSPRHADDHSEPGGGSGGASWLAPASPTAATPLLTVRQQGWKFYNMLFDGPSDAAAVQLFRDGGAADAERDASHAEFHFCKFVAAQNHIEFKGGLSQCIVADCMLFGSTADSILETVGAGIGTNNYHRFLRNHFHDNATHIDLGMSSGSIIGNVMGAFTTAGIDLRTGSENMVGGNYLSGTYSEAGGYFAGTNDEWGGNFNSISGGVTAADPA